MGALDAVTDGTVLLTLPNGHTLELGQGGSAPVSMTVYDDDFFVVLAIRGDVGLGEAYVNGLWSTPDLPGTLSFLANGRDAIRSKLGALGALAGWLQRRLVPAERNTIEASKSNAEFHYGREAAFFASFLGESLVYSCAVFESDDESLDAGQDRKMRRIVEAASVGTGQRLLEIGTGWGALAVRAAQSLECHVTTTTVVRSQHAYTAQLVRSLGLSDQVECLLSDYRQLSGSFDAIVSVEMVEAVGEAELETFFGVCASLLRPGGNLVVQAIHMCPEQYREYRTGGGWIRKHMFPGSCIPSAIRMLQAIDATNSFRLISWTEIGDNYTKTLREWRTRFMRHQAASPVSEEESARTRTWEFYFALCETGFRRGLLGDAQFVLERRENAAA